MIQPLRRTFPRASASLLDGATPTLARRRSRSTMIAATARSEWQKQQTPTNHIDGERRDLRSSALTRLFTGPAGLWSFGGSLVQHLRRREEFVPVVGFPKSGNRKRTYDLTADHLNRLFVGLDSLVEYVKTGECREQQEQLAFSAQDAAQIYEMRYRGAPQLLGVLTKRNHLF